MALGFTDIFFNVIRERQGELLFKCNYELFFILIILSKIFGYNNLLIFIYKRKMHNK